MLVDTLDGLTGPVIGVQQNLALRFHRGGSMTHLDGSMKSPGGSHVDLALIFVELAQVYLGCRLVLIVYSDVTLAHLVSIRLGGHRWHPNCEIFPVLWDRSTWRRRWGRNGSSLNDLELRVVVPSVRLNCSVHGEGIRHILWKNSQIVSSILLEVAEIRPILPHFLNCCLNRHSLSACHHHVWR